GPPPLTVLSRADWIRCSLPGRSRVRYTDHIDYLVSSLVYLSSHSYYWARSPTHLGKELSLDPDRLRLIFDAFPGLYRRSIRKSEKDEYYYAVQARYAQREGGDTDDPDEISYIAPLSPERLKLVIDFVSQMAEAERASRRAWVTNSISMSAAIIAAVAAVTVAVLKHQQ
ncbi:MAG TPA: hypothetical protein VGA09_23915, partial [Candidatus Binatia bacterium]